MVIHLSILVVYWWLILEQTNDINFLWLRVTGLISVKCFVFWLALRDRRNTAWLGNNIPRYYTLNHPRKFIYFHTASQSFRILSANCPFRHILRLLVLFSSFLYVCFSSLFAAGDVSREGTSANQRQKLHTDDVNHCLINKSGSHGVPNANLFHFTFFLVDFGKMLCSSTKELQHNSNACSREDYIPNIDCFVRDSSRLHLTFVAFCLSFVNNS